LERALVTLNRFLCAVWLLLFGVMPASATCNIVNGVAYGDCAGVTVRTEAEPHRIVTGYADISGVVAGATVRTNATLRLTGLSTEAITVERGGRLIVAGIAEESIFNNGGRIEIAG
jgi:hypothetical protein